MMIYLLIIYHTYNMQNQEFPRAQIIIIRLSHAIL